jgi:murein DD-endopeptidase MepM/ murein hydrolase activator NlpD
VVDVSHRGGAYITRYAHLSAVLVREGQRVHRGEAVGRVGSTGLSTGPHLHYEVFVHGRRRDPALLFEPGEAAGLLP